MAEKDLNVKAMIITMIVIFAIMTLLGFGLKSLIVKDEADSAGGTRDFTLQAATGPVSLHDFKGQAVLLFFGYTHCPDVCPTTMNHVASALKMLRPEEMARVQPLFITIDPERDTVEHLKEYTAFFHPKLLGLSGDMAKIEAVLKSFDAQSFPDEETANEENYLLNHTSALFLVDSNGNIVDRMSQHTAPVDIAVTLRKFLAKH